MKNTFTIHREVKYVLSHSYDDGQGSGGCGPVAEFDDLGRAEDVGRLLASQAEGSEFISVGKPG